MLECGKVKNKLQLAESQLMQMQAEPAKRSELSEEELRNNQVIT